MTSAFVLTNEAHDEPRLYRGCGLDGIYLLNGYSVEVDDDEEHVSVVDREGLHRAIGRHLVRSRKGFTGKEIRFLRKVLDLTQAEMAAKLGNNRQSVARWEKGEYEMPGAAEKLLRVIFLSELAETQDDCAEALHAIRTALEELDLDDDRPVPAQFRMDLADSWTEELAKAA